MEWGGRGSIKRTRVRAGIRATSICHLAPSEWATRVASQLADSKLVAWTHTAERGFDEILGMQIEQIWRSFQASVGSVRVHS